MTDKKSLEEINPPEEFSKIINDFIEDILLTFPEYKGIILKWWNETNIEDRTLVVFRHCIKVYPERFFDILYKNTEIFTNETTVNTEFLPGIVFNQLWNCDISDNTKETIWKYLQLILFSVVGSVNNSSVLGDAEKLFEAINEDELKNKLEETIENMQTLFNTTTTDETTDKKINTEDLPSADDLHKHINEMLEGKIGRLAMEMAEEAAKELNIDLENTEDVKDVFQKMFTNPGKMINTIKKLGSKIESKIKSGEMKESELMEESIEFMNKMKSMPGMNDMQKMFSQMGVPGLGKGAKMNVKAMESQMNRNMKTAKMKERLKAKALERANAKVLEQTKPIIVQEKTISDEQVIKIFTSGEKMEKSHKTAKPNKKKNN
jgi:hypothetical protein